MPDALVTGATGLLGSHVVERLVGDGWRVRAMVRDPADARWLNALGAELRAGDVTDADAFARAAAGCSLVVHAAAAIFHPRGWEGYQRSNLDGTRNAVAAAGASGARLVHVSSVAVYGSGQRYRTDGRPTDEEAALVPIPSAAHYARSKRESESIALEAHRQGRVWATAVRPCVIYGRRDRQFVPRMARLVRRGLVPIIDGGRTTLSVVHAANVADGIARAAQRDAAGGRVYNLANDFPVSVRTFFELAARGLDVPLRTLPIPGRLARLGAGAIDGIGPLVGLDRSVASARASVDFISRGNPFSSERARRELGWSPAVRHEEGVPDAFAWWRSQSRE